MPVRIPRLFFCFIFLVFYLLNVFADSSTPDELQKLNALCESISNSDSKILESKTEEEIKQAKVHLVEVAIDTSALRSSCFKLLNEDIVSELGFRNKISLLFLGELSNKLYVFLAIALLFSVIMIIVFFYFYFSNQSEKNIGKESKKYRNSTLNVDSGADEYSNLLEFFSLDETASEAEIKKAYRDMARAHHPDTADSTSREEFELIQTNYDKLMKLRKGWFGLAR